MYTYIHLHLHIHTYIYNSIYIYNYLYTVPLFFFWATDSSKSYVYPAQNIICNVIFSICPTLKHRLQHGFLHEHFLRT